MTERFDGKKPPLLIVEHAQPVTFHYHRPFSFRGVYIIAAQENSAMCLPKARQLKNATDWGGNFPSVVICLVLAMVSVVHMPFRDAKTARAWMYATKNLQAGYIGYSNVACGQ